ncbi:MAG: DUF1343 domain-containing protein [Planctomycetia bacterium]|nr:DUF1343 domain-containing protein [Planctomycetia bacterium]
MLIALFDYDLRIVYQFYLYPLETAKDSVMYWKKSSKILLYSFIFILSNLLFSIQYSEAQERLTIVAPEDVGMDSVKLATIDRFIEKAIDEGETPGAVIAIGRGSSLAFLKAYGNRQVEPTVEPMTTDTLFDLASVSKVVSTALAIHILADQGKLDFDDPIVKFFPDFAPNGKDKITIRQCLTHVAGLIADNSIKDYQNCSQDEIWANICRLSLKSEPGEKFTYSDVGFIVLGKLVEKISGMPQDQFVLTHIYQPLGMTDTMYNPPEDLRRRTASTEKRYPDDSDWIKGEVHDPRAYAMNGVAGHAGIFSTALDLSVLGATLLGRGTYTKKDNSTVQILSNEEFEKMIAPQSIIRGIRSLGWDKRSPYSGNRGWLMSPSAIGHGGFTGTAFWVDPDFDLFVVFLATRLHPDGKGSVNSLAGRIASIAVDSITDIRDPKAIQIHNEKAVYLSPNRETPDKDNLAVLNGIDVLQRDHFELLKDRKVGLITNQTGINKDGEMTSKLMFEAGVNLIALFTPEHGLFGTLDQSNIDDMKDPVTGLPVYSLYGETRRPTPKMLEGIDTLVFDIQDIGARFYTYISTMAAAMQSAADHKIRFVVLDRVNPIGGIKVAGPLLDPGMEAFIAFAPMPVQHGMTIGELALMFNEEQRLQLDLQIVPVENWKREMYFDQTSLPWVNPSPNMRNITEELTYPGFGIPEFTNISVGRGTETPFEIIGAPWINANDLAAKMNDQNLAGITFEPVEFTPTASKYADTNIFGVRLILTDRDAFEPVRTGIALMRQLKIDYPDQWDRKNINTLLLHYQTCQMIEQEKSLEEIEKSWKNDLNEFCLIRKLYLIY